MLDDLFDHLQSLREQPVWRPIPDQVRAQRRTPLLKVTRPPFGPDWAIHAARRFPEG